MKKVLFTATVDSHILHFHIPYLRMFKEKGYEVHVATNGTEEIPYCDVKHVVSFERSPIKINNLKAIKQLKKIVDKESFEIIHCHTPMGSVVTRLAAKKARKKGTRVIYTAHGFHFFKGAPILNWVIFYPIEKYLAKYTDCLITINQEDYDLAKKKFKAKQIELVHGVGVDETKFNFEMSKEEKHELRKSLGLKDDDFVLIQVGELNKNKNQIMSINSMRDLIKENPKIHLLLVGKGELEELYKKKIEEYKLQNNVHLLGYRKDVAELMKISNVLLSLSYREGIPVNVIEGMIVGLPIIATDCRGNRDLIENNKNGYILERRDKGNLIIFIERIYKNKDKEIKFGKESKSEVNQYLLNNIIEQIESIYETEKKVMHLLASNSYSGAENVVISIIKNIKNLKKNSNYIYVSPIGSIEKRLQSEKIDYRMISNLTIKSLKEKIEEVKPDIIHAHDFTASVLASIATIWKRNKVISHIHKNDLKMQRINFYSIIYLLSTIRYEKIFLVSKEIQDEYAFGKFINKKTEIIGNPIDVKYIKKCAEQHIDCKEYDVLYLGRLSEEKNPIKFIEIIAKVKNRIPNIKCAMIGDRFRKK